MLYLCKRLVRAQNADIIEHMKTRYTKKQIAKFAKFCLQHDLKFATMAEYQGAIEQFFSED